VEQGSDPPRGDAYIYALRDETAYLHIDEDEKPEIVVAESLAQQAPDAPPATKA
jgi:hypothetical protein